MYSLYIDAIQLVCMHAVCNAYIRCIMDVYIYLYRLILIAEKNTVYQKFPTPLINRLEKHFVLTSSVLEEWQEEILWYFEQWVKDFSDTR